MLSLDDAFNHIVTTGDTRFNGWFFSHDHLIWWVNPASIFGSQDFRISIIDQFAGRRPLLLNHNTVNREINIRFVPTIILDSHIVNYLVLYVNQPEKLRKDQKKAIEDFLIHMTILNYDINPAFYFLEATVKSDNKLLPTYAVEAAVAMTKIHTMQSKLFLEQRIIQSDPTLTGVYEQEYGTYDIQHIAEHRARVMIEDGKKVPHIAYIDGIYATLLKMALIHKTSKQGVVKKSDALYAFMTDTLGAVLAREMLIAFYYFSGQLDGFIPLQRKANFSQLLRKLKATAWDLLLLRWPEALLEASSSEEVIVAYVCTSEKSIQRVGRLFAIESLQTVPPDYTTMFPAVLFYLSGLQAVVGDEAIKKLLSRHINLQERRSKERLHNEKEFNSISESDLSLVIAELEREIQLFCQ